MHQDLKLDYDHFVNVLKEDQPERNVRLATKNITSKSPWITTGIVTSIRIRNKLFKKNNPLAKFYKSKIRHYIKILRENFFKTQISNNKHNCKLQWDYLFKYFRGNTKIT